MRIKHKKEVHTSVGHKWYRTIRPDVGGWRYDYDVEVYVVIICGLRPGIYNIYLYLKN